jgi:hypothetical protein
MCLLCDGTHPDDLDQDGVVIGPCPSCPGIWLERNGLVRMPGGAAEARNGAARGTGSAPAGDTEDTGSRLPPALSTEASA